MLVDVVWFGCIFIRIEDIINFLECVGYIMRKWYGFDNFDNVFESVWG